MGECEWCDGMEVFTRRCEYCKQNFCADHQLPENHKCPGVRRAKSQGPEFRDLKNTPGDPNQTIGVDDGDEDDETPRHGYRSYMRSEHKNEEDSLWDRVLISLTGAWAGKRYSGNCPNCGYWVTKHGTERYTTCTKCGWKSGLPVVRLFTHYPRWTKIKKSVWKWAKRGVIIAVLLAIAIYCLTQQPV